MAGLTDDPMHNAINEGIKGDIEFLLEHRRQRGAVMLIYEEMDEKA